jgi:hypothetical protein
MKNERLLSVQFSSLKLMLPKRLDWMMPLLRLATIDQRYKSGKRS